MKNRFLSFNEVIGVQFFVDAEGYVEAWGTEEVGFVFTAWTDGIVLFFDVWDTAEVEVEDSPAAFSGDAH